MLQGLFGRQVAPLPQDLTETVPKRLIGIIGVNSTFSESSSLSVLDQRAYGQVISNCLLGASFTIVVRTHTYASYLSSRLPPSSSIVLHTASTFQ